MKKQDTVADTAQERPAEHFCCCQCTHFVELYTIPDTGGLDDMLTAYYAGAGVCVRQSDLINGRMNFRRGTESCEQFEACPFYPKPTASTPRFPTFVV